MAERLLNRAVLDNLELEYELQGSGQPVVLIHPGHFSDWFEPLMDELLALDRYRVLRYHRAGCRGSSRLAGPTSIGQHAAHCASLLRHLGIERAHVVGHSSSAIVALQLAIDVPGVVGTLALLEPALMHVPAGHTSRAFVATAVQLYRSGDRSRAIDTFLRGVCGPEYRAVLDGVLPQSFDRAVADADMFFERELPALQQWSFTSEDAARITQPVLAVVGELSAQSDCIWEQRQQQLLSWFAHAEPSVLPDATHLLEVQNAGGMAEALQGFYRRHPL
jgi:pimeloyl-ACP methyl ester carboxylesterase